MGHESGSYCHTPEESKCNGFLSYMPDCYSLQSYLKGEPNAEYGKIGEIIELKSKIKEFDMLLTDFFYKDVFYIWKITESNIDLLNREEESTTNIYNLILRGMLSQEFE